MGAPEAQVTTEGSSVAALPPTVRVPEAFVKRMALSVTPPCTLMDVYGGWGALAGQAGGMVKGVQPPAVGAGVGDRFGQPHVVVGMRTV